MSGPLDLTESYNTALTAAQERQFVEWANKQGRAGDLHDYDLRGAWLEGYRGDGHGSDKYKKPNHPTFSEESQYSTEATPGGKWEKKDEKWEFRASHTNVGAHGEEGLKRYFDTVEPDATLVLPLKINSSPINNPSPAEPYTTSAGVRG